LRNVEKATAQITSEDELYPNFDGALVAYLRGDFTATYDYSAE